MPTVREHLAQCEHNQAFLDQLPYADQFPDWVVTVCFYKAVHLIDAFLAANLGVPSHPDQHSERFRQLGKAQRAGILPNGANIWLVPQVVSGARVVEPCPVAP